MMYLDDDDENKNKEGDAYNDFVGGVLKGFEVAAEKEDKKRKDEEEKKDEND